VARDRRTGEALTAAVARCATGCATAPVPPGGTGAVRFMWRPGVPQSGDRGQGMIPWHSISTLALGTTSAATTTVERAGGLLGKNFV
jgi:hypothetical protein